jgi:hypothetical protein
MITAGLTNSFKEQLLRGQQDLSADVLKIALYTSAADLGPYTTAYSTANEISGGGYTAGGEVLINVTVNVSQSLNVAYVSFDNPSWPASSFTTRGALIYNFTKAGKSIAVINFGSDQTTLNQAFQIQLPTNNPETALIRIL